MKGREAIGNELPSNLEEPGTRAHGAPGHRHHAAQTYGRAVVPAQWASMRTNLTLFGAHSMWAPRKLLGERGSQQGRLGLVELGKLGRNHLGQRQAHEFQAGGHCAQ